MLSQRLRHAVRRSRFVLGLFAFLIVVALLNRQSEEDIHEAVYSCNGRTSRAKDVLDARGCFQDLGMVRPARTVDMSENGMFELPPGFVEWSQDKIHTLYLSDNAFRELPDLRALKNLRMLSLRRNQVEVLDCDRLPMGIYHLILTDNQITRFVGDCKTRMRSLNKLMMARNRMAFFPEDLTLPNLELIRLPQNRLRSIPAHLLSTSPSLKWASFADNPCCPEPPADLPDLGIVDCSRGKELGSGTSGVALLCQNGKTVFKKFKPLSTDGSAEAELKISSLLPKKNKNILAPLGTARIVDPATNTTHSGVLFPYKNALPVGLPPTFGSNDRFPPEKQGRFTAQTVWKHIKDATCSLQAMHEAGVAHMDLYAHNTLLSEKELVFLDFGAATCIRFLNTDDARLLMVLDVRAFGNLIGNLLNYVIKDADTDTATVSKLLEVKQLAESGIDSNELCTTVWNVATKKPTPSP